MKWWVVASHVTAMPPAFAARTIATDPSVDRCWKWTRAPVSRASAMSRMTISSSASKRRCLRMTTFNTYGGRRTLFALKMYRYVISTPLPFYRDNDCRG